jgi:hypothetical protein
MKPLRYCLSIIIKLLGDNLEKLWHKHKIRELEHEISRGKNELKQSVMDISIKYQIPSKYTAYVAVEHRLEPVSGETQYVKIPISLTSDSNQQQESFMYGAPMASMRLRSAPIPMMMYKLAAPMTVMLDDSNLESFIIENDV